MSSPPLRPAPLARKHFNTSPFDPAEIVALLEPLHDRLRNIRGMVDLEGNIPPRDLSGTRFVEYIPFHRSEGRRGYSLSVFSNVSRTQGETALEGDVITLYIPLPSLSIAPNSIEMHHRKGIYKTSLGGHTNAIEWAPEFYHRVGYKWQQSESALAMFEHKLSQGPVPELGQHARLCVAMPGG